eukprot:1568-Pelagomonas_calceolata.AAC.3
MSCAWQSGPNMQVGYATVFFWEYFGPLIVYPLFFFFPKLFYPGMRCAALLDLSFLLSTSSSC